MGKLIRRQCRNQLFSLALGGHKMQKSSSLTGLLCLGPLLFTEVGQVQRTWYTVALHDSHECKTLWCTSGKALEELQRLQGREQPPRLSASI